MLLNLMFTSPVYTMVVLAVGLKVGCNSRTLFTVKASIRREIIFYQNTSMFLSAYKFVN